MKSNAPMQSIKNILFVLLVLPLCLNGQEKFWNYSDTLVFKDQIIVSKGMGVNKEFYTNINSKNYLHYFNEKRYYLNWALKEEYCENDSGFLEGNYISYYENGVIKEFYTCRIGNRVGPYIEFHENGKKKTLGEYILPDSTPNYYVTRTSDTIDEGKRGDEIIVTTRMNFIDKKNGLWQYWNEKGVLIKSELWDKGTLIK